MQNFHTSKKQNFCFLGMKIKYVGDEQGKRSLQMTGLSLMDKTLVVQGARISFTIWDVGGQLSSLAASNQSYKTQSSLLANRPSIYTLKKI